MLPDGAYYFISTITAGSTMYVHDVSSKIGSENALYPPLPTSYDPWNNQPLTFTYSVSSSKLVTVVFSQAPYSPSIATIPSNCDPPTNICVTNKKGQGPGSIHSHGHQWITRADSKITSDVRCLFQRRYHQMAQYYSEPKLRSPI